MNEMRYSMLSLGVAALIGTAGCVSQPHATPSDEPAEVPAPPSSWEVPGLEQVRMAPEDATAPYDRDDWPHWETGHGWPYASNCDTRDIVLLEQGGKHPDDGSGADPDTCEVTSGRWLSPYDMQPVTDPDQIEIDHMVPLAEAARSGARTWDKKQRERFANDLTALVATTDTVNRDKSDGDPARWKPPARVYWCEYARGYTDIKVRYQLSMDQAEHDALAEMLATCEDGQPDTGEQAQ